MSKANELVLCKKVQSPDTFRPNMKFLQNIDGYSFQKRGDCETDPTYKQLIPYVIFYDLRKDQYLSYYRKAGDGRLLGSMSIGVGGHINPCDSWTDEIHSTHPVILNNINRELGEEIGSVYKPMWDWWWFFRGFLYDPSNEVGKVHVGAVFLRQIDLDETWEFEDREHRFKLASYETLRTNYDNLETWSQIVFDALIQKQDNPKFFRSKHGI